MNIMFIQVLNILNLAAKQDGVTYQTAVRWLCPQSRLSWGPPSRLCRWAQPSCPDTGRWPSVVWPSSHPPQAVEVYPMALLKKTLNLDLCTFFCRDLNVRFKYYLDDELRFIVTWILLLESLENHRLNIVFWINQIKVNSNVMKKCLLCSLNLVWSMVVRCICIAVTVIFVWIENGCKKYFKSFLNQC